MTAAAPTNWLLSASEDLYVFALLAETSILERDSEMAALWAQRANDVIEEMNRVDTDSRFSGTLDLL